MFTWVLNHRDMIAQIIAALGGTWTAFRLLYRKVYKPAKEKYETGKKFYERVEKAVSELENNGGGSMKDIAFQNKVTLTRISEDVTKIKGAVDASFKLSPDCIFQCGADGRCIMVNESICRLFGATKEQMYGFGWVNFISTDEREIVREVWESAVENDTEINAEYTIINGITGVPVQCIYTAYIKRREVTNEIISIFGIVNKKQ